VPIRPCSIMSNFLILLTWNSETVFSRHFESSPNLLILVPGTSVRSSEKSAMFQHFDTVQYPSTSFHNETVRISELVPVSISVSYFCNLVSPGSNVAGRKHERSVHSSSATEPVLETHLLTKLNSENSIVTVLFINIVTSPGFRD
jgi:hypothetical protein